MRQNIFNRFDMLIIEASLLESNIQIGSSDYVISYLKFNDGYDEKFMQWKVQVKNLLKLSCGDSSIHYINFLKDEVSQGHEDNPIIFKRLFLILTAAYDDLKNIF